MTLSAIGLAIDRGRMKVSIIALSGAVSGIVAVGATMKRDHWTYYNGKNLARRRIVDEVVRAGFGCFDNCPFR